MKRIACTLLASLSLAGSAQATTGAAFSPHVFTLHQAQVAAIAWERNYWHHDHIGPIIPGQCHWRTNLKAVCWIVAPDFPVFIHQPPAQVSWSDLVALHGRRWVVSAAD